VTVKVPKGANADTVLRLKGKGVPTASSGHGDMFVKLKIVLPENLSDDFIEFTEKWAKKNSYDPRRKLGWT
jgi:DnaJ-class molecular chaperone